MLAKTFGIPPNRIFNSRTAKFADDIRRETKGRGVDVILNSLVLIVPSLIQVSFSLDGN